MMMGGGGGHGGGAIYFGGGYMGAPRPGYYGRPLVGQGGVAYRRGRRLSRRSNRAWRLGMPYRATNLAWRANAAYNRSNYRYYNWY